MARSRSSARQQTNDAQATAQDPGVSKGSGHKKLMGGVVKSSAPKSNAFSRALAQLTKAFDQSRMTDILLVFAKSKA